MEKEIELDILLRGRKFKKMLEGIYKDLRKRYQLKQVEVEVLLYVGLMPELSATELANKLSLQKGHVSVAMFGLCEKGYLQSEQSRQDRRYVIYRITEEGCRVRQEIENKKNRINEMVLKGFTKDEILTLELLSKKLLNNVEEINM